MKMSEVLDIHIHFALFFYDHPKPFSVYTSG